MAGKWHARCFHRGRMVADRKIRRFLPAFALALALLASLTTPLAAAADDMQSPDAAISPSVGSALDLLTSSPSAASLRQELDDNGIAIRFVTMNPGQYARYSVGSHTIEIDSRWQDADPRTLAAVIAHEAVHAHDAVSGYLASGGASACIDSEVRAFATSAQVWTEEFGPGGKPDPGNDLERQLNLVAQQEERDPAGLEALIRQAYVDQCGQ